MSAGRAARERRSAVARPAAAGAAIAVALVASVARQASAQGPLGEPLGGGRGWQLAPTYEHWALKGLPLIGPPDGAGDEVDAATQWSVPLIVTWPLSRSVLADAYVAYASGDVTMRDGRTFSLSGPTDLKVRATARLRGDNLLATVGLGLPTGKTELSGEEFAALRVLGAPALRFQTPGLGGGLTATLGAVYTRRVGAWAVGAGASFEYRGEYAPLTQVVSGLPPGEELDPGEAVRASVGIDGLVGQHAMSLSLSSAFYTADRLSGAGGAPTEYTLGPAFQVEWQMRLAGAGLRDVTLYAVDRYRTKYRDAGGTAVENTAGNELDFGAQGQLPLGRGRALVLGLDGRHHTGLKADNSIATAAIFAVGATVGVALEAGRLAVQPFARAQAGSMDSGGTSKTVNGFALGISIGSRLD